MADPGRARPSHRHAVRSRRRRYPGLGTPAARDFYATLARAQRFFSYVSNLAIYADHAYGTAQQVLVDTARDAEELERLKRSAAERVPALEALSAHRQFYLEMLLARHIDNYLAYVSALLALIFRQRPETMKSSEKVDVEWVLDHSTMATLINDLAERKVDSLSYSSFAKLYDFARERFGLAICTESDLPRFVEWIETRNLAVHNRGVVNRRYLDRVEAPRRHLGQQRLVGIEDIEDVEATLLRTVQDVDRMARSRLRLRGTRFSIPDLLRSEQEDGRRSMRRELARVSRLSGSAR